MLIKSVWESKRLLAVFTEWLAFKVKKKTKIGTKGPI
jgi:hypothetical protein